MTCAEAVALIPLYLTGELGIGELDTGEFSGSRAREFAEHTRSCAECAGEISRQMALDARLRGAVLADPVDSSAIESRVMARIAAGKSSRTQAWRWGLAAAAMLAIGLTIGYAGYRAMPQATGVFAAAARDHRMEIVERQPRRWRTDIESVNDLAAREGISSGIVSKIAPAGYHFQQAKLCKLDGMLYLHLVYSDAAGAKNFSVFLDRQNQNHVEEVYASRIGAEHVAGFENGHLRAVIVTDQSGDAALTFARFAASVI